MKNADDDDAQKKFTFILPNKPFVCKSVHICVCAITRQCECLQDEEN